MAQDEMRLVVMDYEVRKMREEIYDLRKPRLLTLFPADVVDMALRYFLAIPSLNTMNRPSWELLVEACENAEKYFKEKENAN